MGNNSIVYDLYALATRWTVHYKNRQLRDLYVLMKSLVSQYHCVTKVFYFVVVSFIYFIFP